MDSKTIFTKTAKGLGEAVGKTKELSRGLRKVLKEVDGEASFEELQVRLGDMAEDKLQDALARLLDNDYIREFQTEQVQPASEDLDFTNTAAVFPETLAQLTIGAYLRAVDEVSTGKEAPVTQEKASRTQLRDGPATVRALWQRDAARYNEETVERAHPKPAQAKGADDYVQRMEEAARQAEKEIAAREAELKARREAEARARAEEQAKAEAAERTRRETEEKARAEAETRARQEAERLARLQAQGKAKREADEKARREAEEARRLMEEKARREADEAARKVAEERARREAEERSRREADEARRLAEEKARQEAEAAARKAAEERARHEAEEKARRESAEAARKEAEVRARREAEEKARREAEEARRLAEEKARREAEEAAKREAEEHARREAEACARKEAEEKARLEAEAAARKAAEERARLEAEEKARREAEERVRRDEKAKAQREAEARAREEQERARREAEERERKELQERVVREALEDLRRDAEERARIEAEEARRKEEKEARERAEREEQARLEAERQREREAQEKARLEEERARREAKEAARKVAEEQARLEAEERERKRAEEKAQRDAEALARKQAREEARRKAEEEAKQAAQERARKKAEEKARRKAEKEAMLAAREAVRLEAHHATEKEELQTRRSDSRSTWQDVLSRAIQLDRLYIGIGASGKLLAKAVTIGFLLTLAAGTMLLPLISFDEQAALFEKTASARFHQPVKVGAVHFVPLPRPHWRIEDVAIGEHAQIRVAEVSVVEAFGDWFSENPVIESVALSSPVLNDEAVDWLLFGRPQAAGRLWIGHVTASNAKWESSNVHLGEFDLEAQLGKDGAWKAMTLFSHDRRTLLELHPKDEAIEMELTAENFDMPFGAGPSLAGLHAVGMLYPDRLALSEFRSGAYDGTLTGDAVLEWGSGWSFKGKMQARDMSTAALAPALLQGGRIQGETKFAFYADESAKLFSAPHMEGDFTAANGTLVGIDFMDLFRNALRGGRSSFSELKGGFTLANGKLQLRGMRLSAGLMSAAGYADVDAAENLYGRFSVDLRSSSAPEHADFSVAGTMKAPRFSR